MDEYQKKHDSGKPVWMEQVETVVDDQKISGMLFHLDHSHIEVLITSPIYGFSLGSRMNGFAQSVTGGFNSPHGHRQAVKHLKTLYIEHKEYAAIVQAKREKEAEELARTMGSEDIS